MTSDPVSMIGEVLKQYLLPAGVAAAGIVVLGCLILTWVKGRAADMRVASQVVLYILSFAAVLILGSLFDLALWQTRFHAEHILGGRPLPALSQFFISHHHLPSHLALLPWLALIGAPLFSRAGTRSYWDAQSFTLRYLAFLTSEFLLFLVLVIAIGLPFVPYYAVLETPRQSSIESVVRALFWLGVVGVGVAAVWRYFQPRS